MSSEPEHTSVPCAHASLFNEIVKRLDQIQVTLQRWEEEHKLDDNDTEQDDDHDHQNDDQNDDELDKLTNALIESIISNPMLNLTLLPDDLERQMYQTIFSILKQFIA